MTQMPLIYTDNQSIKKMNLRHPRHLRLKNHTAKLSFNPDYLLNFLTPYYSSAPKHTR